MVHADRIALNMVDDMSGKPLWMASTRADMSGSLAVAMRTSFHVIDLMSVVAVDAQVCVQRHGIGSSRERRAAGISLGGRVVVCCVAATSSDRSGISASLSGFRDKASATVLRMPGDVQYANPIPQRLLLNVP